MDMVQRNGVPVRYGNESGDMDYSDPDHAALYLERGTICD